MAKYLFVYHGGQHPTSEEEVKKVMAQWMGWFESMGSAVIDMGNPLGQSHTVSSDGVADNGGANPANGYSLIEASNLDNALEQAKGCPILAVGGTIEVAEAMNM